MTLPKKQPARHHSHLRQAGAVRLYILEAFVMLGSKCMKNPCAIASIRPAQPYFL